MEAGIARRADGGFMPRAYSPPRARLSASDCEGRAFGALPQRPYDALVGVLDASWTHGAQPQSAALVAALLKALGLAFKAFPPAIMRGRGVCGVGQALPHRGSWLHRRMPPPSNPLNAKRHDSDGRGCGARYAG